MNELPRYTAPWPSGHVIHPAQVVPLYAYRPLVGRRFLPRWFLFTMWALTLVAAGVAGAVLTLLLR